MGLQPVSSAPVQGSYHLPSPLEIEAAVHAPELGPAVREVAARHVALLQLAPAHAPARRRPLEAVADGLARDEHRVEARRGSRPRLPAW